MILSRLSRLKLQNSVKCFIRKLKSDNDLNNDGLDYSVLTDALTDDKWDKATELANFLKALYEMTRRLEGNNSSTGGFGSLWQTLTNLQTFLWSHNGPA
ncbi:hypothetical protein EJ02DRAFT_429376 [Clathrospora elynae]|uniref:Uncharacterized protein n=1 Tax=Clathrospora elynae TaxID=706981 RepID=A0A6A5S2X9_9PLEO|nr:hypothetical protein EJ02DRAFT_429376 [Clathrospora elynae]